MEIELPQNRKMDIKTPHDAAMKNDVNVLDQLLKQDPLIPEKETLNCQDMSPLHAAAMFGNVELVKEILCVSPDMCFAGDRFGRTPLHLAVVKGRLDVLKELMKARPLAAQERVEGGGNVLHLCVKHNQLEALKWLVKTIKDKDFVNRKDDNGMTVLHLAVWAGQTEAAFPREETDQVDPIVKYLVDESRVDVNATNANGCTALDLIPGKQTEPTRTHLLLAGAKRGNSTLEAGNKWLSKERNTLLVVASLVATMAFQAGVNPSGGVWQEDSNKSESPSPSPLPGDYFAGESVMAFRKWNNYRTFIQVNTVAFVSSLSTILFLISGLPFRHKFFMWALMMIMWLTVTAVALTYSVSISMVTPHDQDLLMEVRIGVIVWCGVLGLLLLGNTIRFVNSGLRRHIGTEVTDLLAKIKKIITDVRGKFKLNAKSMIKKGSVPSEVNSADHIDVTKIRF